MQTAATPSRLMWTRSQIAEAAGVSTATVDRLIADGTLPAHRLGPGHRLVRVHRDVAEARERLVVIEREARDLEAISRGAEEAVRRAETGLVEARRSVLPELQAEALEAGEKLKQERAQLEARLSDIARRESELQARWVRELCAAVPTYAPGAVTFEAGETQPRRLPTDAHPDLVWLVPTADWPA